MAGFREFQTGEVLTAANVDDYLAKQAVMKFADSAARDTALGTAVGGSNALREGMVAWLDDTDEVIAFDGTSWATVGNAGIGSNVVSAAKTDTFSTTSTSYTTVTGLSVTITPTSATSKILLVAQISVGMKNNANFGSFRFGGGNSAGYTGASPSSRTTGVFGGDTGANIVQALIGLSMVYVDSPATTSATTYTVEAISPQEIVYVNRSGDDTDNNRQTRGASSLIAIEVAA